MDVSTGVTFNVQAGILRYREQRKLHSLAATLAREKNESFARYRPMNASLQHTRSIRCATLRTLNVVARNQSRPAGLKELRNSFRLVAARLPNPAQRALSVAVDRIWICTDRKSVV